MTTKEKPAEICKICIKQRELSDLSPRMMQVLGLTEKKKIEVLACDVCDGGVVKLSRRGSNG